MDEEQTSTGNKRGGWRRKRVLFPAIAVLLLFGLFAGLSWMDSSSGQRWLAERIAEQRLKSGLSVRIGRIDGSLFDRARLQRVELRDLDGTFLTITDADLDWDPGRLLRSHVSIRDLHVRDAILHRMPRLNPSDPNEPLLPDMAIDIGRLRVDALRTSRTLTDEAQSLRAAGEVHVANRIASIKLAADALAAPDHVDIRLIAEPDRNRFDVDASILAPPDGVLARLAGWKPGLTLRIGGKGDYARWRGQLVSTTANAPLLQSDLVFDGKTLSLKGSASPNPALPENARSLLVQLPQFSASMSQTSSTRALVLTLSGPAATLRFDGMADRALRRFVRGGISVDDPQGALWSALQPDAKASQLSVTAKLGGGLRDPSVEAHLRAAGVELAQTKMRQAEMYLAADSLNGPASITATVGGIESGNPAVDRLLQRIRAKGQASLRQGMLSLTGIEATSSLASTQASLDYALQSGVLKVRLTRAIIPAPPSRFGAANIALAGTVERANRVYVAKLSGPVDLRKMVLPDAAKRLLGLQPRLAATIRYANGKTSAESMILDAAAGHFTGKGSFAGSQIAAQLSGRIVNAATLMPQLGLVASQPMPLILRVDGSSDAPRISAELAAPLLKLRGVEARDARLNLQPLDAQSWRIAVTAQSEAGPVALAGTMAASDGIALRDVRGKAGPFELMADAAQLPSGNWNGKANIILPQQGSDGLKASLLFDESNRVQQLRFAMDGDNVDRRIGEQRLQARNVQASGTILMTATPRLTLDAGIKSLRWRDVAIDSFTARSSGPVDDATISWSAKGTRGVAFELGGDVSVTGSASVQQISATLDGRVANQSTRFMSPLKLERVKDRWIVQPVVLQLGRGALMFSAQGKGRAGDGQVKLERLPLDMAALLLPGFDLGGTLTGEASLAMDGERLTRMQGKIMVQRLQRASLVQSAPPLDLSADFALAGQGVTIDATARANGKAAGSVQLLIAPGSAGGYANAILKGAVHWNGPADALTGLANADTHDLRGPLQIDASIGGQLRDPDLKGSVSMKGGRYENLALGMAINGLDVAATFDGAQVTLQSASGKMAGGGSLSASGVANLSAGKGFPARLAVTLNKAAILNRDDLEVITSGTLDVVFGADGGKVSGPLTLDRMRFTAGNTKASEDIPQVAVREINLPASAAARSHRVTPWSFDIAVKAPERIFVNGLGLISEWGGNFSIVGTTQAPALSGRLQVLRGTYEFAGRRFTLDSGSVNFDRKDRINPVLNIRATTSIKDTTGIITIQGTALRPQISFSSSTALPQDEVLSRILFGASIDQLSPLEGAQLAGAIAQLSQGGIRKLNVFGQVSKLARIDRLRVLPANEQLGSGTAISGGKYIGERLYLEVATDGRGYTATNIEVTLTRALSILSQIATLGGTNVNLKWRKDY